MESQPEPPPISETIRRLIEADTRTLKRIAVLANADYQRLHRWYVGRTATFDADMAESVYKTLTGKSFTRGK